MSERMGVVCVHYQSSAVAPTLRALEKVTVVAPAFRNVFVANQASLIPALKGDALARCESSTIICHDNSGLEFGAYQAGLTHLLTDSDPDWVLFVNDTFATHQRFGPIHRARLIQGMAHSLDHPIIVGQVASLPRSYQIKGLRTHRWTTTNVFALNRAAIQTLSSRIYRPELNELITEKTEMPAFFSQNVDQVLREHLETWLFGAHPGWHWYAAESLQPNNAIRMARKARSIMQEKYLAALLEEAGAEFVDLNSLTLPKKILRELDRRIFALRSG